MISHWLVKSPLPEQREVTPVLEMVSEVLTNLKLNQDLLPDLLEVVRQVELQMVHNPEVEVEFLVYRVISHLLYLGFSAELEYTREGWLSWLENHLHAYILPRLHQRKELAEELTNEALAIICNKFETCNSSYHFLTWCRQVAVRLVLQFCRKEKALTKSGFREVSLQQLEARGQNLQNSAWSEVEFEEQESGEFTGALALNPEILVLRAEDDQAQFNADPQKVVVNKEQLNLIIQKVMAIKPTKRAKSYQQIFFGTYFQGLTDQELAQKLGLSLAEIHKRRFQLLTILRSDQDFLERLR